MKISLNDKRQQKNIHRYKQQFFPPSNISKRIANNFNLINSLFIYMTQRIKVVVRPKPLTKNEIKTFVNIDYASNTISLHKPHEKQNNLLPKDNTIRAFAFPVVFPPNTSQQDIYEECGFSIVENVLEGYNGTIFAYGQTGSGKTYTIMGSKQYMERKISIKKEKIPSSSDNQPKKQEVDSYVNSLKGIIPRTFNQIIAVTKSKTDKKHLITCSFMEIYNQNVHDLLGEDIKANLLLKESQNKGLVIQGLKSIIVKSVEELERLLKLGYKNRAVRQTSMNKESSRSHCIFSIKIEEQTIDQYGNATFRVGKLNLVDLAGSQRQSKTQAQNEGMKEATKINLSLSALGKVINCLSNYRSNQKIYIPYRDSKLTRILQDSLGGNTKTVMIATVATNSTNYEETLSTLIYASRAKFIQNSPVLNEDPKDVLLREYMYQIKKLKVLLQEKQVENQNLKEIKEKKMKEEKQFELPPIDPKPMENSLMEEEQIKKKIEDLQNLVKKQNIEKEEIRQLQKIQHLKKKIKIQQQRQHQLQLQKKQRQEDLLSIQKDYRTLNEEVDTLRSKFKDLKQNFLEKCEELQDYRKEYNEDKVEYHYIIRQKDKQIKKLQKMLATVLEEQTYKQVVDQTQESGFSQNQSSSSYSTKKLFNNIKVENKAKIKVNEVNLYQDHQTEKSTPQKTHRNSHNNDFKSSRQKIYSLQRKIDSKNYESQHEKNVKKIEQERSKYSSLTSLKNTVDKQKQKRERIKKVDSMISLKPKKGAKLPFITQVNKLKKSRNEQSSDKYASKLGLDIGQIKNEILSELRYSKRNL